MSTDQDHLRATALAHLSLLPRILAPAQGHIGPWTDRVESSCYGIREMERSIGCGGAATCALERASERTGAGAPRAGACCVGAWRPGARLRACGVWLCGLGSAGQERRGAGAAAASPSAILRAELPDARPTRLARQSQIEKSESAHLPFASPEAPPHRTPRTRHTPANKQRVARAFSMSKALLCRRELTVVKLACAES